MTTTTTDAVAVTVPAAVIRACLPAMSTERGRYSMDTIRIDYDPAAKSWRAQATDGKMGAVLHFDAPEQPATNSDAFSIDLDAAKQVKAAHRAVRILTPHRDGIGRAELVDKHMRPAAVIPIGAQAAVDSFPPLIDCRPAWGDLQHKYTPSADYGLGAPVLTKLCKVFAAASAVLHMRTPEQPGKPLVAVGRMIEAEGIRELWALAMPVNLK